MTALNTYTIGRIEATPGQSLTLVANDKISLVSTANIVTISGNTIVTLGPFTANRTMKVIGTLSAGTFSAFSPVYVSSTSTINLIAPTLSIQGSIIVTAGYFISTGSFSSSHVLSGNTLSIATRISGNSLRIIGAATVGGILTSGSLATRHQISGNSLRIVGAATVGGVLTSESLTTRHQATIGGTLNLKTISTTDANSLLVSSSHNISITATNAGEINLTAAGDKITLTASTIAITGAASITGRSYMSGTLQVNNLQNISGTKVNLTASSLVVAEGTNLGFKHTKGLFTTGYTVHTFIGATINYSLPHNIYVLIAQIEDPINSCTISLSTSPIDGETHTIKGLHIGSGNATMKIATSATNGFEGGKQTSPYSLTVTSSPLDLRAVTVMYVASKLSWYILSNYKD